MLPSSVDMPLEDAPAARAAADTWADSVASRRPSDAYETLLPLRAAAALARLARHLPSTTPVIFGRAVGRADESLVVTSLTHAGDTPADMATLIIVGSRETRVIAREGQAPLVYTPRAVEEASAASSQRGSPSPAAR